MLSESELRARLEQIWKSPEGLTGWFKNVFHKPISERMMNTSFIFFALAGVLALLMRVQLAVPENTFLRPDLYNQFFTVHGSTMMLLFAVPVMQAVGLYFVPLMIGTRNLAFPRLNAFDYYMFLIGGLLLWVGLALNIGADTG